MGPDTAITTLGGLLARWELLSVTPFLIGILALIFAVGATRLRRRGGPPAFAGRRIAAGLIGFLLLFVASVGPPEALADELFAAHMVQHVLYIIAAPALLLANPMPAYLWGLPRRARDALTATILPGSPLRLVLGVLTHPRVAFALFAGNLWLWHFPPAYNLALEVGVVHLAEHTLMFTTAMLFWWPIIGPAPLRSPLSYPSRLVYLLLVVTPTAALGALITLSPDTLYTFYEPGVGHFGFSVQDDQRLAGILLWVPGNFIYLAALVATFFRWADQEA